MGKITSQKLTDKSDGSRVSTKKRSSRKRKNKASLDNPWPSSTMYMSKQLALFPDIPSIPTIITMNGFGSNSRTLHIKKTDSTHTKI